MKFCILTPRFPLPENGGDVLRINNIAKHLKKNKHNLILVSFIKKNPTNSELAEIHKIYDKIHLIKFNSSFSIISSLTSFLLGKPIQVGYFFSFKFLNVIKKTNKTDVPDFFLAHLLRTTSYLNILKLEKKSIVELTDALSRTYSLAKLSKTGSLMKLLYKLEEKPIKKYELQVIKHFSKVILVSQSDKLFLGNYSNLHVFPNGINCMKRMLNSYDKNKVVFVGNMRTLQNQDSVIYFLTEIFPMLKLKFSDIKFYIIGAEPPPKITQYADNKSVFVTGFVESIEKMIFDSVLSIACINIAAGIQNKVLISMACGIPVVVSKIIANGIPELINNENCIIANTTDEYVENISTLILNSEARNILARNGYYMIKDHYSWDKQLNGYEKL